MFRAEIRDVQSLPPGKCHSRCQLQPDTKSCGKTLQPLWRPEEMPHLVIAESQIPGGWTEGNRALCTSLSCGFRLLADSGRVGYTGGSSPLWERWAQALSRFRQPCCVGQTWSSSPLTATGSGSLQTQAESLCWSHSVHYFEVFSTLIRVEGGIFC